MSESSALVPVLEARSVSVRFGHLEALRGIDFVAYEGRVTALIGDNGAGKSTLVKLFCGALMPSSGEIWVTGKPAQLSSPQQARMAGVEAVFQSLALAPDLSATANLFVGRELTRGDWLGRLGILDDAAMHSAAEAQFARLGAEVRDVRSPVTSLSGGQRQSVAICRAFAWSSRAVILDEPTAALGVKQTRNVLDLIRRVRDEGRAVVLVSHNMPDVLEIADDIEVLRLGRRVARIEARSARIEDLVVAMTSGQPSSAARV